MEIENSSIVFYEQSDNMKIDPWLLYDMKIISQDKKNNSHTLIDYF